MYLFDSREANISNFISPVAVSEHRAQRAASAR